MKIDAWKAFRVPKLLLYGAFQAVLGRQRAARLACCRWGVRPCRLSFGCRPRARRKAIAAPSRRWSASWTRCPPGSSSTPAGSRVPREPSYWRSPRRGNEQKRGVGSQIQAVSASFDVNLGVLSLLGVLLGGRVATRRKRAAFLVPRKNFGVPPVTEPARSSRKDAFKPI